MSLSRISTVASLVLVLLTGCHPSEPPAVSATGSAQLSLTSQTALPADVSRVTVTVSAADMTSVSADLAQTNGEYGGVLSDIPAGSNRTFLARAYTSANTLRYEGRAEGVTITVGATTLVTITLQDVTTPPPFSNEAPVIQFLVANPATVAPGGTVSLTVSARDPNTGDTLSYAWSATAGTFSSATQASTSWTAPATQGPVTLTVTVSDGRGAATSQRLTVPVSTPGGASEVKVGFNTAPKVATLTSSQSALDVGQQTTLAVSATDAEGDSLSYQWAATCAGSFTGATAANATFTPSALPTAACNNCQVSVTVNDGRGGQNTGSLALCVTKDPYLGPPKITLTYQSSTGVDQTLEVEARDPSGTALSFTWAANVGTLGTATTGASSSRVVWTPPSCTNSAPSITATVSNTRNQKTTRNFTMTGLPTCAANWTTTGAMSIKRTRHMATLLLNGKVLVTGGTPTNSSSDSVATAELYDPATGTWSSTGSMAAKRYSHTATLLSNGKVLVAGGINEATAELYDPATGTWSPTGSLSVSRYEHQAVLLSNGKVLVAGGATSSTYREAELYNPATGTWSIVGASNVKRGRPASAVLADGRALFMGGNIFVGGNNSGATSLVEVYNPTTNTWSTTAPMSRARYNHSAAVLTQGKVLVVGGSDTAGITGSAELYDPATDTWSVTGSMLNQRYLEARTLLTNGKVLIVGGNGGAQGSAEVYDPATGTWTMTGVMVSRRDSHTATLLSNGKVLVTGGYSSGGPVATVELYDPSF